ncbi:MFS transporter [Silvibacterium sp.]|uniref:MFS transporter n=1 Tax=Silvibacterium sp. TaxID=1964179 RepID=UPI0039E34542
MAAADVPDEASPKPESAAGIPEQPPTRNQAAPHLFLWVVLPYAIYMGFTTNGGASFLLRQVGMSAEQVANSVALLGIPSTLYFLWSPLADLWMPRRYWHFAATLGSAASLAIGSVLLYRHAHAAVWCYFFGLAFAMLISSAYGGLISAMIESGSRTRTAAWAQASNLGGGAIGPGLLLYLALHWPVMAWASAAALLMVLPGLSVLGLKEPPHRESPTLLQHWKAVGRELKLTCLTPKNAFGLILLLAPPGAGALIALLPAIASDYGVSGASVVWINGIGGGLLMALGCLAGVLVPATLDRRIAYALAGALNAAPAFFLAFAAPTPTVYMVGTVTYLFTIGFTSAVCMGLVLDVVGAVGQGGSMRYSILMACSYVPIAYMSWLEGRAAHYWGFRGFAMAEAISSLADLPLILLWLWWRRRLKPRESAR